MEKFSNALFSMRAMALAMMVFFIAIGTATFIESSHGIQSAKWWVYNARWFEILLGYLSINLIANIFRYKMWMRHKMALFAFHLSFIIIIIGAGVTRFTGFEGLMLIREGQSSNFIYSSDPYLTIFAHDQKLQFTHDVKLYMADNTWNGFSIPVELPGHGNISIEYVDFLPKHIDSLIINDSIEGSALDIVTDGMKSNFVGENEVFSLGNTQVAYGDQERIQGINVYKKNGQLFIRPNIPIRYIPMSQMQEARRTGAAIPDSAYVNVAPNEEVPFATTTLYMMGNEQFVFKRELQHAKKYKLPSGRKDVGSDYLVVNVTDGKQSKQVTLEGGMGMIPTEEEFFFNGLNITLGYGSKKIPLPFSVKCEDFILDRYPGSEVPSSYASDLQILDTTNNYFKKKHVFMNHVLDYGGYRFFQSGYDPDELGTRLSVNHDYLGTNITYLGYLLMAVGMILSLMAPTGRFRELIGRVQKSGAQRKALMTLLVLLTLGWGTASAQEMHDHDHEGHNHEVEQTGDHAGHTHDHDHEHQAAPAEASKHAPVVRFMSEEHSDELASLLVQDFDGRIVPLHTVCDQLLRKLYRNKKYEGHNAVQVIMSMHMYPEYWLDQPVIQVPAAVREQYGLPDYATFKELSDDQFNFKWMADYNAALQKRESQQSETQKKLIKLVEKHQVFLGVIQWSYMKLIPVKNDKSNTWYVPLSQELMAKDSLSSGIALRYLTAVDAGAKTGGYIKANELLAELKAFQRATAPKRILPSQSLVQMEISYNKMGIFKNAQYSYLLIGFVLLLLYFCQIFVRPMERRPQGSFLRKLRESWNRFAVFLFIKHFRIIRIIFVSLLVVIFLYHGAGLVMRWYISGHAPWSNGYEAVVFIAWVTMLAGFIFSRSNAAILAGTALLAFFMIFVTEMNLLDPEITPLQPVLKSYWLMIHVAIITGSYGFLGLAAMLGLFNLFLYIFRGKHNTTIINMNINELTHVSEMTMTVGLFMLTIGTFLGGIWANESWGRYWGWDPKETWALVSVLVYAIILHLRYIPALKGKFLFNVVSFWGYSAILFTFFGVNFILVGLHSYAQGDGSVSLPLFVQLIILGFAVLTLLAIFRNKQYKKHQREQL